MIPPASPTEGPGRHRIPASAALTRDSGDPRECFRRWRASRAPGDGLLLVDFQLIPYWLDNAAPQPLTALFSLCKEALAVAVTDRVLEADVADPTQQYRRWVKQHGLVSFDPSTPTRLGPLAIAKPWGREIWYTGVERRGVCQFVSEEGSTPIPWLQAALPVPVAGAPGEALVLLKILDPLAQPVTGDLYFELHEKKREVYVVTQVDRGAWPDGVGYMRYGFDPQQIVQHGTPELFRAAYLASVLAYEKQRRALDLMTERGEEPGEQALERERDLRDQMDRFTKLQALRVGDVIAVPQLLPHALQHGVRTVEFQTPSYDRKILSFGQKVLTQDHWDSREAVAQMRLLPPRASAPVRLAGPAGTRIEQIAVFDDFEAQRVIMQPGARWELGAESSYRLLLVVSGELTLQDIACQAEEAILLPHGWRGELAVPEAATPLVFLLAWPRS